MNAMNKYHYTECGLDFVYLQNGFTNHATPYGDGISIEASDSLDRSIAALIVKSTSRLSGQCVKFLRTLMDLSQRELACKLGTQRITVARWESKKNTPIPGASDRLIRMIYATATADLSCAEFLLCHLEEFNDEPIQYLPLSMVKIDTNAGEDGRDADWGAKNLKMSV